MPGAQRARSRGRGSGRRASAAPAAHARDHRASLGGGAQRASDAGTRPRPHRHRLRASLGRAVPGRAGAHRPATGRADRLVARWHAGAAARRRAPDAGRGAPVAGGEGGVNAKRKVAGNNWEFDGTTITVRIPMTWKRRGGRKVIIAPDGGDAWAPAKRRPDETVIRALARAHRWKRMLEEGRYRSAELAGAEKVTRSFGNRLLRLTLSAPDIVEASLEGRQPKAMQLEEVTRAMPSGWEEQPHRLTFERFAK